MAARCATSNYAQDRDRVAAAGGGSAGSLSRAKRDPHSDWSAQLSRVRYRIDTVFGQSVERCTVKRDWARDLWHLSNHLLRKVLLHTLAALMNISPGNAALHLAKLVAGAKPAQRVN